MGSLQSGEADMGEAWPQREPWPKRYINHSEFLFHLWDCFCGPVGKGVSFQQFPTSAAAPDTPVFGGLPGEEGHADISPLVSTEVLGCTPRGHFLPPF